MFPQNIAQNIEEIKEEAKIIEPFPTKPEPNVQNNSDSQNTDIQPDPNTVKIPLSDHLKEEREPETISFKNSDFLKSQISKPTAEAPSGQQADGPANQFNPNQPNDPTTEVQIDDMEYEIGAGFLIELVDIIAISFFRWFAIDTSEADYQLPVGKKNNLKKMLTEILKRMSKKAPLMVLFIIAILATYATPALKARDHRKKVKEIKIRKQKSASAPAPAPPPLKPLRGRGRPKKVQPEPEPVNKSTGITNPESDFPPKKQGAPSK